MGAELVATIAITRDETTVFPKPRFSNLVLKVVPFVANATTGKTNRVFWRFYMGSQINSKHEIRNSKQIRNSNDQNSKGNKP